MTAVSTVAGILPVALGLGVGSETRQPMALVVAGGMLSSTAGRHKARQGTDRPNCPIRQALAAVSTIALTAQETFE